MASLAASRAALQGVGYLLRYHCWWIGGLVDDGDATAPLKGEEEGKWEEA